MAGRSTLVWGMAALFTLGLAACGGGGGGGVSYPSVSYSGVKTEADLEQLSEAQRAELGVTLLENGSAAAEAAGTYTAVAYPEPTKKRMTLLAKVAERVRDDVLGADATQFGAHLSGVTQRQGGDCGGSVSVTDNSGGGRINGSVTYSDFCMKLDALGVASITMHGGMEFSGSYTLDGSGDVVPSALTVTIPRLLSMNMAPTWMCSPAT